MSPFSVVSVKNRGFSTSPSERTSTMFTPDCDADPWPEVGVPPVEVITSPVPTPVPGVKSPPSPLDLVVVSCPEVCVPSPVSVVVSPPSPFDPVVDPVSVPFCVDVS